MNTPIKEFQHEISIINNDLLHKDILRKLNRLDKSQRWLQERLGMSRNVFWRIGLNKEITLSSYFKLVGWLNEDLNKYVTKTKLK